MTIATTTSRIQYTGNGVTTAFAFPYLFLENTDLEVINTANYVDDPQVLDTDYTVSGAGGSGGGTVTYLTAPASGVVVTIARIVPLTQLTDYIANDRFSHEAHERALDKLTMLIQQLQDQFSRTITLPLSEDPTSVFELPPVDSRNNRIFGFDNDGLPSMMGLTDVTASLGVTTFSVGTPGGTSTTKSITVLLPNTVTSILVKAWIVDGANSSPTTERSLADLVGTPSMDMEEISDPASVQFTMTNTGPAVSLRVCVEVAGVVAISGAFSLGV